MCLFSSSRSPQAREGGPSSGVFVPLSIVSGAYRGTVQSFFVFLKRKLIDEVGWEGGGTESGREREKRKKCIEMLTVIVARRWN